MPGYPNQLGDHLWGNNYASYSSNAILHLTLAIHRFQEGSLRDGPGALWMITNHRVEKLAPSTRQKVFAKAAQEHLKKLQPGVA